MLEVDRVNINKLQAEDLEYTLFSSLNPVEPDPEFVSRLRNRFDHTPSTVMEHPTFWAAYIIVATGLFFGALLIWLVQSLVGGRKAAS